MRFHYTFIALPLIASLFACTTAQHERANIKPVQKPAPATPPEVADPMASFARMIGGEWKVTFASGTSMYDTYHWGPGKHSGREMTHGQDAAGNPWRGLGVTYWHPGLKRVCSLSLNPYEGSGQPQQNGPYRYDGKTLYHLKFPKHPREDEFYATHPLTRPWSPYEVYCVYKDRKGHLWFGTASFGICRFDGKHLDWMYEDHLTQVEGGGMFGIRSIIEDKAGAFWFCNTQYRYRIEPHAATEQGNGLITYKREKGMDLSGTSLREKFFYYMAITEDSNGDLWMATSGGGVWRYDGKNLTHFPVKDGDKDVTLFSISKDNRGDLWLGTHEAGAYKFNGKTFEKFAPPGGADQ